MNEMAQSTEREMIVSVIQINASDRDKEGNIQKILDFLEIVLQPIQSPFPSVQPSQ